MHIAWTVNLGSNLSLFELIRSSNSVDIVDVVSVVSTKIYIFDVSFSLSLSERASAPPPPPKKARNRLTSKLTTFVDFVKQIRRVHAPHFVHDAEYGQ